MILPKVRDPRFITFRRGGTLSDSDHHLLALWAASCAEHVLHLFESVQPEDPRPREAIEHARAWVRGEVTMMQARAGRRLITRSCRCQCAGRGILPRRSGDKKAILVRSAEREQNVFELRPVRR